MESLGTWTTVYEIAGRRHGTKQGRKPLSDHAYEVLEAFMENEVRELVALSMGFLPGSRF